MLWRGIKFAYYKVLLLLLLLVLLLGEGSLIFSGVQPDIFQSRRGFVELGSFDKLFFKNTQKKAPQGKILELFLLDTLKTTFWMEDSTQRWTQLGPFFPKVRALFWIFKKGQGIRSIIESWSKEVWSLLQVTSMRS